MGVIEDMADEQIEDAKARAVRGDKPASSLGYCKCCTVWNMPALGDDCPDCGETPAYVEVGREHT